jgi:hypothetical protein
MGFRVIRIVGFCIIRIMLTLGHYVKDERTPRGKIIHFVHYYMLFIEKPNRLDCFSSSFCPSNCHGDMVRGRGQLVPVLTDNL